MTASSVDTAPSLPSNTVPQSDLIRVDAHVIAAHEYDEAPDLAAADLADAVLEVGGAPVRRGRPPKENRKLATSLRLDPEVLAHFKAGGAGWQGRMNDWLARHELVLAMIDGFQEGVDGMESLLVYLRSRELKQVVGGSQEAAIAKVEGELERTRALVVGQVAQLKRYVA